MMKITLLAAWLDNGDGMTNKKVLGRMYVLSVDHVVAI